jgi:hypothetical protein
METYEMVNKQFATEVLVSETNLLGTNAHADAGADTNTILDISAAFSVASVAVGYLVYQVDAVANATVNSITNTTIIETTTLTGAANFSSAEYVLPLVKRYLIEIEGNKYLTIQSKLVSGANTTIYLKIYGTINDGANANSDSNWVDISEDIFGATAGITVTASTSDESLNIIDMPLTFARYMLKLVVVNSTATAANSAYVLIKKSS